MNIDSIWEIAPWLSWTIILAGTVGPLAIALLIVAFRRYRFRQQIKRTPGPLLGVLYPQRFETLDKKDRK